MARKRFKTTRVFIRKYPTDNKIVFIKIDIKRHYTIVLGHKVYLSSEEVIKLQGSVSIYYDY